MPSESSILVTGTAQGLGKYLYDTLPNTISLKRENRKELIESLTNQKLELIIHCAFNSSRKIENYYQYLDDNILLTQELCKLRHTKFIYISSIDVYGKEASNYKTFKLMAEALVQEEANNVLILRCSALLGPDMRKNNFLKLVEDERPSLTLSSDSIFNFVLYKDILRTIEDANNKKINGIYDFVSNKNITLDDIAKRIKKNPTYGNYKYLTSELNSVKLIQTFKFLNKSSIQVIDEFLKEIGDIHTNERP